MRILVVDDKAENRYLTEILLRAGGHETMVATNGREALDKLRSEHFDMVISDVLMPVMDGFRLCQECRRDKDLSSILFVIFTASYTDDADEALARRMGANDFIRKPAEPEELLQRVQSVEAVARESAETATPPAESNEKETLRLYSERLVAKLEHKVAQLQEENAERRRVQEVLRQSEEKYRTLFEASMDAISLVSPDGHLIEANKAYLELFGYTLDMVDTVNVRSQYVNPSQRDVFLQQIQESGILLDNEVQLKKPDGTVMDCVRTVVTRRNPDGSIMGYQNVIRDITERKRDETMLREYAEHLQSVREEERTGIARELHDQLGQALTALKLDLKRFRAAVDRGEALSPADIDRALGLVDSTTSDVRRISSELRPGVLDDIGLVAAMEWQLEQVQQRTDIKYELMSTADDSTLDRSSSTALFRVFQELVTNVLRHAGASAIQVTFEREESRYVLTVSDNGRGITEAQCSSATSLGLVGMRERVRPLRGTIEIAGSPDKGTTSRVSIPAQ